MIDAGEILCVNDADEAVELVEVVLERRGSKEDFFVRKKSTSDCGGNLVLLLEHVPELVRLVKYDEIPRCLADLLSMLGGKMVGADDDIVLDEGILISSFLLFVGLADQDGGGEEELLPQLEAPLVTEGCWNDDEYPPLVFGPALGQDDTRLDGLPEAHFVG